MNTETENTPGTPTPPAQEAVRAELERLLADPLFRHSQRAGNLLKFIVEHTLTGQQEQLRERTIGVELFGRAADYDTGSDSTVRVAAAEVRKRLGRFYENAPPGQALRIEIPLRSYVAEFVPAAAPEPPLASPTKVRRHKLLLAALLMLVVLSVAFGLWLLRPAPLLDRFWAPMLRDQAPVLICVGSPLDASGRLAGATSLAPPLSVYGSEDQMKVGLRDATMSEELAAFLRQKGKFSVIRPTPGRQLAELRSNPIFLYGMFLNEWVAELRSDLRFRFRKESVEGQRWIEDRQQPANRDWSIQMSAPLEQVEHDYALISRLQDKSTGRWWISVAGLTSVGTHAASQLLLNARALESIAAGLPAGWEKKNLQIVLEVRIAAGSPGDTRVLRSAVW